MSSVLDAGGIEEYRAGPRMRVLCLRKLCLAGRASKKRRSARVGGDVTELLIVPEMRDDLMPTILST